MNENHRLGARIREMRQSQDMSLSELADEIGKTSSYLSQVERGLAEPSITALREIAKALGVPIFYFLVDDRDKNAVIRKDERKKISYPSSDSQVELISPDLNRQMELVEIRLQPGEATVENPLPHRGEECTLVMEGRMYIEIGEKDFELEPGDSIYYVASVPHKIVNVGEEELVLISAITPPNF
ncbi:helix-turn-helix domain-containing protein [Halarsenatibacter silvermanii]|uniref:Cupin domain-containing protein n=1 Tax=Halarsenatibacter silvermanii TaxID=321763 RepID=A0A1G9IB60_9FIRM|nr:helix-turn-helix domain-containing protein [Halarsenatibacter silvermanii]SDL22498.1 Cupin domain-containing protein [Halarsenatibacter silvermanii]